jgi:NAD(P)-dependent dehydrogenase (short-subunit alcohol dehydrogenase family)
MAGRLEGKVIVILGTSDERSMGAATARRCQAEGAKLVLAARRLDRVQAIADSLGAVAIGCDITDEQQLAALADAAVTHYGKLDGAINFAGIETSSAIADISREVLQQNCEVHLIGTTLFIKHMAARMSDGGSVVTTSSQTALLAPPGLAAYAGTKAGADHIVRIAAVEYGGQNIRVNSLSPGFTPSAMTEGFLAMPSIRQAFLNEIPMGKLPSIEDMANAALWLLSDESFMTGRMLDISGGQTLRRVPTATEMGF